MKFGNSSGEKMTQKVRGALQTFRKENLGGTKILGVVLIPIPPPSPHPRRTNFKTTKKLTITLTFFGLIP